LKMVLSNLGQAIRESLSGPAGPVTVSMGAALLEPDESWSAWLARADCALFAAKRAGRDRIRIAK